MVPCLLDQISLVQLFVNLWTVAHRATLSKGFSSQEYWSVLPCPPSGDLPDPEIEMCLLHSLHWQAGVFFFCFLFFVFFFFTNRATQKTPRCPTNIHTYPVPLTVNSSGNRCVILFHNILQKNLNETFNHFKTKLVILR